MEGQAIFAFVNLRHRKAMRATVRASNAGYCPAELCPPMTASALMDAARKSAGAKHGCLDGFRHFLRLRWRVIAIRNRDPGHLFPLLATHF